MGKTKNVQRILKSKLLGRRSHGKLGDDDIEEVCCNSGGGRNWFSILSSDYV